LGEKREKLGMNTKRISSIVMLSYLQYSSAYELEHSCFVIIMIYELAYSFRVMILTYTTLCLTIISASPKSFMPKFLERNVFVSMIIAKSVPNNNVSSTYLHKMTPLPSAN
jgi:hypothetical protein